VIVFWRRWLVSALEGADLQHLFLLRVALHGGGSDAAQRPPVFLSEWIAGCDGQIRGGKEVCVCCAKRTEELDGN